MARHLDPLGLGTIPTTPYLQILGAWSKCQFYAIGAQCSVYYNGSVASTGSFTKYN